MVKNGTFKDCLGCENRHLNCHSECKLYKRAKEQANKEHKVKADYKRNVSAEFIRNNSKKYWRKKGQI